MDLPRTVTVATTDSDAMVGIDVLRGLAVAGVVAHHLQAHLGLSIPWLGRLGGLLGVELFFIVSGFLIARSAAGSAAGRYAWRRVCRIYPVYWLVVLALTAAGPVGAKLIAADGATWTAFVVNLLALSHAYPPALAGFDVTTVSWSLTVELAWYLVAPWLMCVPALRPPARGAAPHPGARRAAGILVLVALAVSVGWVWLAQRGVFDAAFRDVLWAGRVPAMDDFHRYAYVVNAAPAHAVFFAVGAAWAALGAPRPRGLGVAVLLGGAMLATLPWADRLNAASGLNPSPWPVVGLSALFIALCAWDPARGGRWPALSVATRRAGHWIAWVGRVSYPLYLVHVPVMLAVAATWRWEPGAGQATAWLRGAFVVLLSLAVSALLHRWVEQPAIRFGRRLGGHPRRD